MVTAGAYRFHSIWQIYLSNFTCVLAGLQRVGDSNCRTLENGKFWTFCDFEFQENYLEILFLVCQKTFTEFGSHIWHASAIYRLLRSLDKICHKLLKRLFVLPLGSEDMYRLWEHDIRAWDPQRLRLSETEKFVTNHPKVLHFTRELSSF